VDTFLKATFFHSWGCARQGWHTRPEMAALFGVTPTQFDRRYRRYALPDKPSTEEPGTIDGGSERVIGNRLMFYASDVVHMADQAGVFDKRRGPRLRSIVCPSCKRTVGMHRAETKGEGETDQHDCGERRGEYVNRRRDPAQQPTGPIRAGKGIDNGREPFGATAHAQRVDGRADQPAAGIARRGGDSRPGEVPRWTDER
jgi:hypothetical protein